MNNKKFYDEESIQSLSPLEFTRLRPQVYCGSTEYSTQLLSEVFSNAVDEFKAGHCKTITVSLTDDTMSVEDDGQGFIPMSYREDGKTVLEASFSVLNTSGKFTDEGVYEGVSLGLYGIGAKLPIFLSTSANVISYHGGEYEHVWFKDGVFEKRDNGKSNHPSGTIVTWTPDAQFFTNTTVEIDKIKKLFKTISCLCPGLTINLNNNGENITYSSTKGLNDLVDDGVKDSELIDHRFIMNFADGKHKLDLVMTYTSNYSATIIPYVNTGLTETGPHITQFKTQLTKTINKFLRDKKWLKDKDENLTGDDIQEGMYLVFNITAPGISYDAQVKSRVTKLDMKPFLPTFVEALYQWCAQHEKDIKLIADKALLARKAREAAKKARDNARENAPKAKNKTLNLPTKLVDAWGKNRSECELLIAEGDSAAGGLIGARDGEIQAVFPIRGKIINLYKASYDKVFANQEVVNIIKALGLELDSKTNKMIYDKNKLRYGRIILCADADPDGQAIKNLLLTCFWALCPELIINGHLYCAIPPLFRITTKKNEYIYLRDAAELDAYKLAHAHEKYAVNRNKGLGEQDAEELEECLLNAKTRNVAQITVEDATAAAKLFEIFMGPSVGPRKDWILAHSEEANEI